MFHTIIIAGNLGKDPEMRFTPNGKAVTSFSVAVSDGWGDNKRTIWFRVSAWDKQAETCNQYLKKGSKVLVEGRLQCDDISGGPRVWESNGRHGASFEISASTVRFLSSARDDVESGSLMDEVESF
jgi:single-strand DNA-binding protein